ncbi:hypothetical protein IJT17_03690 [bacterium]|nr:hypothetical protein [bacterium]
MQHKLGIILSSAATISICYLVSGCSSHNYEYKTPNISYNSVYLSLKVSGTAIDSLEDVNTAYIYAYDKSGARVTFSSSQKPLLQDKRYSYSLFCPATATTTTIDFFNANGDFIGCTTVALPELGKDLNKDVDVDSVYDKEAAQKKYSFVLHEKSANKDIGGEIELDAVLKTPVGEQIVTRNQDIDWSSTDIAVIRSYYGEGVYEVVGSGTADAEALYNDVFKASRSYTIL